MVPPHVPPPAFDDQQKQAKARSPRQEQQDAVRKQQKKTVQTSLQGDDDEKDETAATPSAPSVTESDDPFVQQMLAFFSKNGIDVESHRIVKKKKEADFTVRIPSSVGSLLYYCKAKDKKTCNDADLSTAYVQGEAKKLPVLFITTGTISRKAQSMLQSEFKTMTVKALG